MADRNMTFKQFQTSREASTNLGAAIGDECLEGSKGNVYVGCLFIEEVIEPNWRDHGRWHLSLNNDDWLSDDLEMLERKLYEFGCDEGYCRTPEQTIDAMCQEYSDYCFNHQLNSDLSADELLHELIGLEGHEEDRKWLADFIKRWNANKFS